MADEITKNDDDETIEETTSPKKKTLKGNLPIPPPVKKERTQAQILAFEKARASREANLKKREADAKRLEEYDKLLLKQKLVDKAEKIKLKTMKKIETIENISSSEDEVVIEKKKTPRPEPKRAVEEPRTIAKPKIVPYKFV